MKLNKSYGVFLTVLLMIPMLLAACGGDDGGDEEALPTRVVVGDATAEVIEETPEVAEETQVIPPVQESTPEVTSEVVAPPVDAPPNFTQQETTAEANPPGVGGTTVPENSGPPGMLANALEDFSGLAVGDSVLLTGVVSIVEGADGDVAVISDDNDLMLEINSPLAMTQPMVDQQLVISGEIVEAAGGSDAELAIVPNTISASGGMGTDLPMGENNSAVPPVANEGDAPPFPGMTANEETLDIELESDMTALESYDALVEAIGDELEGTYWYRLSGSATSGWTFEFVNPEAQTLTRYTVNLEGAVMRSASAPAVMLTEDDEFAIDRELVGLDSDVITEAVDSANDTPFGAPLLMLAVNAEGTIEWVVSGPEPITFDATQPLED